jgi:hypothetical protein
MTEALLERYRSQKIEPLAPDVIERMVHSALQAYDSNLYETVWQRTSLEARARLMALLLPSRVAPEPEAEWVPAVLQELRADAGPVSMETIEQELDKLDRVRAIGCRRICSHLCRRRYCRRSGSALRSKRCMSFDGIRKH